MKTINTISEKKWKALTTPQKHKYWINIFLEIEKYISTHCNYSLKETQYSQNTQKRYKNKLCDLCVSVREKENVIYWLNLLKDETDKKLKQIHSFFARCPIFDVQYSANECTPNHENQKPKTALLPLYSHLRYIFNNELINQKDFHFLPTSKIDNPLISHSAFRIPNLILLLDNLRSAFNVGSIIRTAECLNITEIWGCGYTPPISHPKIKNTAMGCEKHINWQSFTNTADAIKKAKKLNYTTIALETHPNAKSIYETDFPQNSAIILGNEAIGISTDTLSQCDKIVNIPLSGWKTSLNVATACAVVCFEIMRKNTMN